MMLLPSSQQPCAIEHCFYIPCYALGRGLKLILAITQQQLSNTNEKLLIFFSVLKDVIIGNNTSPITLFHFVHSPVNVYHWQNVEPPENWSPLP